MDGAISILAPVAVIGIALLIRAKTVGLGGLRLPGASVFARKRRPLLQLCRLQLTPQHSLHLVEWNGREYLVTTSPAGCRMTSAGASSVAAPAHSRPVRAAAASTWRGKAKGVTRLSVVGRQR